MCCNFLKQFDLIFIFFFFWKNTHEYTYENIDVNKLVCVHGACYIIYLNVNGNIKVIK